MKAVIMAGGRGTRLSALTHDEIPKPLVPVAGKPILQNQIETLIKEGIDEFIISIGYQKEKIKDFLGDGSRFHTRISYLEEDEPLGSGGALFFLKHRISGDFLILSGDIIFDIDVKRMMEFHKANESVLTLLTHPNQHPYDSDIIRTDEMLRVLGFDSKDNKRDYYYHNRVNAGFFICNAQALDWFGPYPKKVSMEHDFIQGLLDSGYPVFAYHSTEYIKDVGTVDRIAQAETDMARGVVAERNLSKPQHCIFLDRDGTINVPAGFIRRPEDFSLLPNVVEAIQEINRSRFLAIVVTNQPVIARGECTVAGLDEIHKKLETLLGYHAAYVDDIVYCPHHPDSGFPGEVPELKRICECRKPKPGMLLASREKWNINLGESWMIGDSLADIQAGKAAGTRTIFIGDGTQRFLPQDRPDYLASSLYDAVKMIVWETSSDEDSN